MVNCRWLLLQQKISSPFKLVIEVEVEGEIAFDEPKILSPPLPTTTMTTTLVHGELFFATSSRLSLHLGIKDARIPRFCLRHWQRS